MKTHTSGLIFLFLLVPIIAFSETDGTLSHKIIGHRGTGTARSVQRLFSLLLHSKYPGQPPSAQSLANCGTAVETGDVGKKPIRERESSLLSPGYIPQNGSSVEEGYYPVRGCGCCSASESRRGIGPTPSEPPGFIHGEVQKNHRICIKHNTLLQE
jgi:hypothetical protein